MEKILEINCGAKRSEDWKKHYNNLFNRFSEVMELHSTGEEKTDTIDKKTCTFTLSGKNQPVIYVEATQDNEADAYDGRFVEFSKREVIPYKFNIYVHKDDQHLNEQEKAQIGSICNLIAKVA